MPHVVSIVYTPASVPDLRPGERYARVSAGRVRLVEGHGIEGDAKGGPGRRQVNLMAAETLEELSAEGFKTGPGEMGEQIVVAGIDPRTVAVGTRVRVGIAGVPAAALAPGVRLQLGGAVVEVTLPRTGCDRFERIQERPKQSVQGRLGVLARVVSGGEVAVGDEVRVVEPACRAGLGEPAP